MRGFVLVVCALAACSTETLPKQEDKVQVVEEPVARFPNRTLRLGRVPHISQETTFIETAPLAKYLATQLGRPLEVRVPRDYEATIAQLAAGEIDVAILAPLSYVVAKKRIPELVLVAQIVAEGGGQYLAYIVTATDGPVNALADLRGKRFAYVDQHSTTGYLLPLDLLMSAGIDPLRDFKSTAFAGSHPDVVELVLKHKVDAGAIASTTFGQMPKAKLRDRLRILAKSAPVPFDAVVARAALPAEYVEKLRATLLDLSTRTDEGRAVLSGVTLNNGFVEVNDAAYDGVRRVAEKFDALQ
ncbi:MAG: phosphate/phosphite/phosphonate ABC transporter substrate-binding protein [Clostridia bacterium]|nr:phosphate/phosphite/phosphonate ABC transporter substrate-binding protein [Deltaproteobacteria bacterium]